jgi:hypothetical protein
LTSILVLSPSLHLSPRWAKPLGSTSNRQKCMSAITKHVTNRITFVILHEQHASHAHL